MAKHTPNTSEPSHPHPGSISKEHVDIHHYGEGGKRVGTTPHVTDEGHVKWGAAKKEHDESKKK